METNEMTLGKAIKNGYKHWDDSSGKMSRKEYWYFFLFNVLIFPIKIFLFLFFVGLCASSMKSFNLNGMLLCIMLFAAWLIIDYPLFNATKRRLSDAGYLKGMVWMGLLPLVGHCALLYMLCQTSK